MTGSSTGYSLEKSLGHLAARFARVLLRRINLVFTQQEIGITAEQYSLLVQLWDRNGLPQGALAEKTARDKTTMARLAAGLEAQGLIARLPSAADARERLLFLSDKGKNVMDRATSLVHAILAEAQRGIDPEQLETSREVLRRLFRNLQN